MLYTEITSLFYRNISSQISYTDFAGEKVSFRLAGVY